MREVVSRIQRIGLVNSGMFDLLDLNTDVRAMHLVGDNNVGKTSLIELIQFLYFPQLSEMHFSKTLPETLSFYFRPEGSYLLFELRTLRGTRARWVSSAPAPPTHAKCLCLMGHTR